MKSIRRLRKNEDAGVAIFSLKFLILILVAIVVIAIFSLMFGIFTLIGLCLLIAAAFILWMKKGAVTVAPNSVFMWLLIAGVILVCFGQFVMDIGNIDLRVIPGLEAIHNSIRVGGGGEI